MAADEERLGTWRMLSGLASAALAGLLAYISLQIGAISLEAGAAAIAYGHEWESPPILELASLYLIFGLPISLIMSLAIGLPLWKRAESRPLRTRRDALRLGALVGGLIGVAFLLLNILLGLQTYLSDSSSYDSWSHGYQTIHDGLPTPIGWVFEILNLLYFALAGAVGGLVARWVAFPRSMKRSRRLPGDG